MLKKRAFRNPVLYVTHHGARYLFPLLVTPYLALQFGPSQFADFVIWNSCVWTAALFMEYGFFLYAVNETAKSETKSAISQTFSKVVTGKLLLLPVALIVYAILTALLGVTSNHPGAALIGVLAVVSYGGSFAWYFQGQERAGTAISVEAFPQVVQFALIFLLVHGAEDVWVAALLQTLAAVGTISISVFLIARERLNGRLSMNGVGGALQSATPYFVERLCLTLYQTAGPLFITALSVKEQAAYYSVGDKFLQFLGGLSIPISYALLPVISRRLSVHKTDWNLSIRVVAWMSALTCTLALVSFASAKYIILLLFRSDYASAVPVAQCFCIAACFVSYNACISNFILIPSGRSRVLIVTSITALVLSLGSQYLLLPTYGALGSALSRTIAEIAVAIILTMIAFRSVRKRRQSQLAGAP